MIRNVLYDCLIDKSRLPNDIKENETSNPRSISDSADFTKEQFVSYVKNAILSPILIFGYYCDMLQKILHSTEVFTYKINLHLNKFQNFKLKTYLLKLFHPQRCELSFAVRICIELKVKLIIIKSKSKSIFFINFFLGIF